VHVVEIVEMDDEELYVSDYVLEEASAARYQMLPKKPKLRIRKNWTNLHNGRPRKTSE
jgi:uncharacterized protein YvpB